jgi:hypothetical protein
LRRIEGDAMQLAHTPSLQPQLVSGAATWESYRQAIKQGPSTVCTRSKVELAVGERIPDNLGVAGTTWAVIGDVVLYKGGSAVGTR